MISESNNASGHTLGFSQKKVLISAVILVIFYAVGIWGLLFSGRPEYFQNLTPLNLLLTNFLLFLNHKGFNRRFFLFALVVFSAGFLIEVSGVHTGFPFGNYTYGEAFGFKLWEVPLLIGLNWLMLVYSAGSVVYRFFNSAVAKALVAALFMVMLDFLIEPMAMKFDFWSWEQNEIPWFNYAGWFGMAFLLQLYFQHSGIFKKNKIAYVVWALQCVFFFVLNLFA